MALTSEGIIFGDLLVNNEQVFIDFFKEHYKSKQSKIDNIILNLQIAIKQIKKAPENFEIFQRYWKEFQSVVLLNTKDLELIVGYRDQKSGKNLQISQIIKQSSVETSRGIETGNQIVKDAISINKAKKIEQVLSQHLNGFLNELYDHKMNVSEAEFLLQDYKKFLPKTNQSWKEVYQKAWYQIYYGSYERYFSGIGLGQAYDAYMNHIGNHHKNFYNYLSSGGQAGAANISYIKKSVYNEEGGIKGKFPQLLYDSLNHSSWYSGGDIIIVNPETLEVVYNIQLKTTSIMKNRIPTTFEIKLTKLSNFLTLFSNPKNSPDEKAKLLFQEFKRTVSNSLEFEQAPQVSLEDILKNLNTKRQLNIKIF